ncbi:Hypothetical protein NTJ_14613 [Nesidiocoris tenuis]|uniref:Reverse transcriptase domain-containing protein n=1 Tax=Nesidiocoris tenuis TaxID=355587 RepID=A0ABN7BBP9_9HEMI|nr:Hypothetical protein NTJ_14613 [Nesidiocoris tenuis]
MVTHPYDQQLQSNNNNNNNNGRRHSSHNEITLQQTMGNSTICVFLDLCGAYNSVNISKLTHKLTEIGTPPYIALWIGSFFINKHYFDGIHSAVGNRGLDQGSTISPLLFNIYTSHIGGLLGECKMSGFADDFSIRAHGRDMVLEASKLQRELDHLTFQFEEIDLQINPNKSKFMVFLPNRSRPSVIPILHIGQERIQLVESHKYLGLTFDKDGNWNKHIENVVNASSQDVTAMKFLKGSNWGNNPKTQLILYKAVCRPKMEYASTIYLWKNDPALKKLQVIQNKALRHALGAVRTTPVNSLHAASAVLPIRHRVDEISLKTTNKYCSTSPTISAQYHEMSCLPSRGRQEKIKQEIQFEGREQYDIIS